MATITETTGTTIKETTATTVTSDEPARIVLYDVPWDVYERLREVNVNRHVRMTYHDGTLELTYPLYRHEKSSSRLTRFIWAVVEVLDIPCACAGAGSTTLRRKEEGPKKGSGKEPDTSFHITNEHRIRERDEIDLDVDPPPDLAIEVDNTADSEAKLPVYAKLGVPEVWRYDAKTGSLWFGRLQTDGTYRPIERSECLPMLTPALVLDALGRCRGVEESRWGRLLRDWVRAELAPNDGGEH